MSLNHTLYLTDNFRSIKMKKTFKLLTFMALVSAGSVWAMTAEEMKTQAIESCKTSTAQLPEAHRKKALDTCVCSAKKTDYKAILAGDTQKVQEDALKNAQECAKEAGVM